MDILDIDWLKFLDPLPRFRSVPLLTRMLFVEKVRPNQSLAPGELGEHCQALGAAGLLVAEGGGQYAVVPSEYRLFCRVMRALHRHRIFGDPSIKTFLDYLNENFAPRERTSLCPERAGPAYNAQSLYSDATSIEWIERYLAPRPASEDMKKAAKWGGPEVFVGTGIVRATQALVSRLRSMPAPMPLAELRDSWPADNLESFSPAVMAGIRRLLLFPALRGDDLEPVLGIWPGITSTLFRPAPKTPGTITPVQTFEAPVLMDDMIAVLVFASSEPLRVRVDDYQIFERTTRALEDALTKLPDWVENNFTLQPTTRINLALAHLHEHEMLEKVGEYGVDRRLEVSDEGTKWLGIEAKDRLKVILDGLISRVKKAKSGHGYSSIMSSLVPYAIPNDAVQEVASAMLAAYAGTDSGSFWQAQEFCDYHRRQDNPIVNVRQRDRHFPVYLAGNYVSAPGPLELEQLWANILFGFLRLRLLPLGAAKVGIDCEGAACFTLTEIGRYLVGTASDFHLEQAPGRVVVQPNFEVVFLAPSPRIEAEIGRFAERKGKQVGTLFKITKRSVVAAAAAGMKCEQALEALGQRGTNELPANVVHEISGWFAQCRHVSMRIAQLIYCPDAETALRVRAIAGNKVAPVSDLILELYDGKEKAALVRKLREAGIFLNQ